mmetsp:Transcript_14256/g.53594  ORF Transcript_14256/g.53594 Transcript_14256/m.53594 type:complete len:96 (+) Transcript_14256:202-489(+)
MPHRELRAPSQRLYRARFLRPEEAVQRHIGLVSYPRSGNSMVRGLLERLTGILTGSDTKPDFTLSRSLIDYGMEGEGICDGMAARTSERECRGDA